MASQFEILVIPGVMSNLSASYRKSGKKKSAESSLQILNLFLVMIYIEMKTCYYTMDQKRLFISGCSMSLEKFNSSMYKKSIQHVSQEAMMGGNLIEIIYALLYSINANVSTQYMRGKDSFRPHGLQHARLPCLSPSPRACSNSILDPEELFKKTKNRRARKEKCIPN